MKVPWEKYLPYATKMDADVEAFVQTFDEPPGALLEVGAYDEPLANLLAEIGFKVTGVDLRDYDGRFGPCKYNHVVGDFCDLPVLIVKEFVGKFDCVISVSAIEHFGLDVYPGAPSYLYYDLVAMRLIWAFLRPGGTCYVSVPYGKDFLLVLKNWRVYNQIALVQNIVQTFALEGCFLFIADDCVIDGQARKRGDKITQEEADRYGGDPPHVSVLLKLRKPPRSYTAEARP